MLIDHSVLRVNVEVWKSLIAGPDGLFGWLKLIAKNKRSWKFLETITETEIDEAIPIGVILGKLDGPCPELPSYIDVVDEDTGEIGEYLDMPNRLALNILAKPGTYSQKLLKLVTAYGNAFSKGGKDRTRPRLDELDLIRTIDVTKAEGIALLEAIEMSGWISEVREPGATTNVAPTVPIAFIRYMVESENDDTEVMVWCQQAKEYLKGHAAALALILSAASEDERINRYSLFAPDIQFELVHEKESPLRKAFVSPTGISSPPRRAPSDLTGLTVQWEWSQRQVKTGAGKTLQTFLNKQRRAWCEVQHSI